MANLRIDWVGVLQGPWRRQWEVKLESGEVAALLLYLPGQGLWQVVPTIAAIEGRASQWAGPPPDSDIAVPRDCARSAAIHLAATALAALAESAQASTLLRSRLQDSTDRLQEERDVLRESMTLPDGTYLSEEDEELVSEWDRALAANRAALAHTRDMDEEASA